MSWTELIFVSVILSLATLLVGLLFKFIIKMMGAALDLGNLLPDEQLALLEAVVMTIYIDSRREFSEEMALQSLIKQGKWKFDPNEKLETIKQKAANAIQNEQEMQIYLDDIKKKVQTENAAQTIILASNDFGDYGHRRVRLGSRRFKAETVFLIKLRNRLLDLPP